MNQLSLDVLRSFSGVGAVHPWSRTTALVVIDMQKRLVRPDGFTVAMLEARGLQEAARQYSAQLSNAIPNMQALLERARRTGQFVVHLRAVKLGTRDTGGQERRAAVFEEPADAFDIIEELWPASGEIVIDKPCSGAFMGTNLDFVLRRLGVQAVTFVGVVTNGCVEQSITQAHDLGYVCILPGDAAAAATDELHDDALLRLDHRRAHVTTTARLIASDHLAASTVELPLT